MPTKIEWTDETWNPIRARNRETGRAGHFCVHVSPACEHCYAEVMQARLFGNPVRYAAQDAEKVEIFMHENALMQPLRWRRPRRIFVCSMTDLFYEGHSDELIDRVFAAMALAPQHTFQVLTKRAERMHEYLTRDGLYLPQRVHDVAVRVAKQPSLYRGERRGKIEAGQYLFNRWPRPNIWLGVSAEDQRRAEERIPHLLDTPASVRFLSAEPLLGPIDLTRANPRPSDGAARSRPVGSYPQLDWVIGGGESGHGARPMHPDWARGLRDQCQAAGVAYFHKQNGEFAPALDHVPVPPGSTLWMQPDGTVVQGRELKPREVDLDWTLLSRLGKKRAGRLLDGREWNEMPA